MPLEHKPVVSSSVKSIGYHPESKTLEITFHGSGKTYSYKDVPWQVHAKLMLAKSVGKYVSNVIQPNHVAKLVR